MSRYPVKAKKQAMQPVEENVRNTSPFLSFRYSYTEMSVVGGKARLKSRHTRLDDGKLSSETFEGELDRSAYDQAVNQAVTQAQEYFRGQTELFLRSLSLFLPRRR